MTLIRVVVIGTVSQIAGGNVLKHCKEIKNKTELSTVALFDVTEISNFRQRFIWTSKLSLLVL